MKNIETKADMMREFHITMKVTCEYCKHGTLSEGKRDKHVVCNAYRMLCSKNAYCADWKEKGE